MDRRGVSGHLQRAQRVPDRMAGAGPGTTARGGSRDFPRRDGTGAPRHAHGVFSRWQAIARRVAARTDPRGCGAGGSGGIRDAACHRHPRLARRGIHARHLRDREAAAPPVLLRPGSRAARRRPRGRGFRRGAEERRRQGARGRPLHQERARGAQPARRGARGLRPEDRREALPVPARARRRLQAPAGGRHLPREAARSAARAAAARPRSHRRNRPGAGHGTAGTNRGTRAGSGEARRRSRGACRTSGDQARPGQGAAVATARTRARRRPGSRAW